MPLGFGMRKRRGWRKASGKRPPDSLPANCICPKCGLIMRHQRGIPCFRTRCPRCDSPMVRQFMDEH